MVQKEWFKKSYKERSMKDKVLILGGSHRDIPLIKAAQELSYFTITLGKQDYYLGHNYSDKNYKIDFNDLEKIKEIILKENIQYIVPGCGEESYLNTVKLSHELGIGNFDSLEVAQIVHNKWKFKEFCLNSGVATPKGFFYTSLKSYEALKFPLVVKPTKLSAGRGVNVVYNENELEKSLATTKELSDEIFLEEYIEGELLAYSVFLKNQKIVYGFLGVDKPFINPYLVSTAYPTEIEESTLRNLKLDIEKIAKKLNLVDGMFHLQLIIRDNQHFIIDVTRRIPGDFYPNLIEFSDGVRYSQAVLNAYLGKEITTEFNRKSLKKSFVIRHCVMAQKNGTYKKLIVDDSIKSKIIYKFDLISNDSEIKNYMYNLITIVFIKLKIKDDNITDNINKLIYPIIEGSM
jgi:biotin carboxylase